MADTFKFPKWDISNPIGKYKQPEPNTAKPGNQVDTGYPQTEIKEDGITMRGYGAATKGIKSRGPMG